MGLFSGGTLLAKQRLLGTNQQCAVVASRQVSGATAISAEATKYRQALEGIHKAQRAQPDLVFTPSEAEIWLLRGRQEFQRAISNKPTHHSGARCDGFKW